MKEQLTAIFQKVPEGYIAFVEEWGKRAGRYPRRSENESQRGRPAGLGGEPYSGEGNNARQISHSGTPRANFMKRIDLVRHLEKHGASSYASPIRTQTHYAAFRTGG
jgi:hypothetical protein